MRYEGERAWSVPPGTGFVISASDYPSTYVRCVVRLFFLTPKLPPVFFIPLHRRSFGFRQRMHVAAQSPGIGMTKDGRLHMRRDTCLCKACGECVAERIWRE